MKRFQSAMTVVMLVIFTGLVWVASSYPADARFMPYIVGFPAIGLCILQLVLDARRRPGTGGIAAGGTTGETAPANEPDHQLTPQETLRREIVLWAYFLAFVGGVLLFGFWVSIPLFLVTFLRFQAKATWRTTLLLAFSATAILYLILAQTFQIELHRGFATEYLSDMVDTGS
jgi:Tripartite tricarboxylate transporter TctB family